MANEPDESPSAAADVLPLPTWARETLRAELSPDADWKQAALAQLQAETFAPPAAMQEAILALARPEQAVTSPHYRADRKERLQEEVQAFTDEFFALAVEERARRHAELCQQAQGYPEQEAHLYRLQPGLRLSREELDAAPHSVNRIMEALRELFLLTGPERARRRRELAEDLDWEDGARVDVETFRRSYPHWMKLDPELVLALVHEETQPVAHYATYDVRASRREAEQKEQTGANWGAIGMAVFLISGLLRALSSSSPPPATYSPPRYSLPSPELERILRQAEELKGPSPSEISPSIRARRQIVEKDAPPEPAPKRVEISPPQVRAAPKPKPLPKDLIFLPELPSAESSGDDPQPPETP